jgi:hypothetical protein
MPSGGTSSPETISREKGMVQQVQNFIGTKTPLRLIDLEWLLRV